MLHYAAVFLIIAIIAAVFGFGWETSRRLKIGPAAALQAGSSDAVAEAGGATPGSG